MVLITGTVIIIIMLLTTDKRDKHLKDIKEQNEEIIRQLKELNSKKV